MSFKNLRIYSVALDENLKHIFGSETQLEAAIANERLKPISHNELSTCGFVPLFGRNTEAYSYTYEGNHFFRFVEENKLMPPKILSQAVLDSIDAREEELGRKLTKAEKDTIKLAVRDQMLAKAFITRRELYIWVNSRHGYVGVSVSSANRAENAITIMRKAMGGSFPAKLLAPRCVVEDRLTNFLKGQLPEGFEIGYDCVLKSNDDTGATVRASKEDLACEEIANHIKAGKLVTELQLKLHESVQFVLNSELVVKRFSIDDEYLKANMPMKSDDAIADMQASFIIESDVLTDTVNNIVKVFDCDTGK